MLSLLPKHKNEISSNNYISQQYFSIKIEINFIIIIKTINNGGEKRNKKF